MGLLSLEKALGIPCIGKIGTDQCKGSLMNHHTPMAVCTYILYVYVKENKMLCHNHDAFVVSTGNTLRSLPKHE
jgi:hypothetical protein